MKSIFLTFLIFAGVFLVVKSGALFIISENWFHYLSFASFGIVMLSAVYFTIFYKKDNTAAEGNKKELKHDENE